MNDETELLAELARKYIDLSAHLKGNADFKQTDTGISFKSIPVVTFFGDKGAIMAQQPRQNFCVKDHVTFDDIIDVLREQDYQITRVVNFSEFFNTNAQFDKLVNSTPDKNREFSKAFGLKLTETDLGVISSVKEIKDKLSIVFGKPEASVSVHGYKFTEFKESEILLFNKTTIRNKPAMRSIQAAELKKIFIKAKPFWNGDIDSAPSYNNIWSSSYSRAGVVIHSDRVEIGFDKWPRSEVERAAIHYGWFK